MAKQQPVRRKHVPQRTCVVCREKQDKRQLTRIVRTPEGDVIVDETGKKNGRGAYVCAKDSCWDKLTQTNILSAALKTAVTNEQKDALLADRPKQTNIRSFQES